MCPTRWVIPSDVQICYQHGHVRRYLYNFTSDREICVLFTQWLTIPSPEPSVVFVATEETVFLGMVPGRRCGLGLGSSRGTG